MCGIDKGDYLIALKKLLGDKVLKTHTHTFIIEERIICKDVIILLLSGCMLSVYRQCELILPGQRCWFVYSLMHFKH